MIKLSRRYNSMAPAIMASPRSAIPVSDEGSDPQAGISLPQVIAIVQSYWKLSLMLWIAFTALAAVALRLMPKTYTATTTLIVDTNQKDPLAGQEFPVSLLNNYVATQSELIQGPAVLFPFGS